MGSSAPDPQPGDAADGTDPPVTADNLVAQAVAELYGAEPQEFTDRRKTLAAAAKASGDAAAARQIAALRKPTRAAWVVNRLARADPGAPARLTSLAGALRAAEQAKDGPRLRELSAARGPLIDSMTSQALAAADVADPPAGLRDEVTATLTAALADPEVAAGFAAGSLTRAAEWAGFGLALAGGGADEADSTDLEAAAPTPLAEGRLPREKPPEKEALSEVPGLLKGKRARQQSSAGEPERARHAGPAGEAGSRLEAKRAQQESRAEDARLRQERLAEETAARLAQEAAEAAARRQKIFADAERTVASAAAAATDAVAAEDRLEREVRDLEERLTQARAKLSDARLQARRAEAAERKARRTLENLPPPENDP